MTEETEAHPPLPCFPLGSVVYLASSPHVLMTVERHVTAGVVCVWLDPDYGVHEHAFQAVLLRRGN